MCSTQDRSDPWQTKHKNTKTQNNMDQHPQWAPRPEILEQDCMHHRMGVEYCVGVLTEPEGGGGVATPRASFCCATGGLPVGCVLKTEGSESRVDLAVAARQVPAAAVEWVGFGGRETAPAAPPGLTPASPAARPFVTGPCQKEARPGCITSGQQLHACRWRVMLPAGTAMQLISASIRAM
jgi:hypothetical protein